MARPPVGKTAQGDSDTALAAHVASRMVGVGSDRAQRNAWLRRELGLVVGSNGLERAALRARDSTRGWTLVDEYALPFDLQKALVVFPGTGNRRDSFLQELRALSAVRQIVVTRSRRDVLVVLVYRPSERDELFGAVDEFGQGFVWEEILEEDRGIEASAWIGLATRLAREESLEADG